MFFIFILSSTAKSAFQKITTFFLMLSVLMYDINRIYIRSEVSMFGIFFNAHERVCVCVTSSKIYFVSGKMWQIVFSFIEKLCSCSTYFLNHFGQRIGSNSLWEYIKYVQMVTFIIHFDELGAEKKVTRKSIKLNTLLLAKRSSDLNYYLSQHWANTTQTAAHNWEFM